MLGLDYTISFFFILLTSIIFKKKNIEINPNTVNLHCMYFCFLCVSKKKMIVILNCVCACT